MSLVHPNSRPKGSHPWRHHTHPPKGKRERLHWLTSSPILLEEEVGYSDIVEVSGERAVVRDSASGAEACRVWVEFDEEEES